MRAILLILAFLCVPALADDLIYKQGTLSVRLTQAPCTSPALALMLAQLDNTAEPRRAIVHHGRELVESCWGIDTDADIVLADAKGGSGFLPHDWFKRVPSI